jgi:choline monooxygenase
MLNIMPGRLQTNRVVPTGLDTCVVEFDFYYQLGAESRAEDDFTFSDQVQEEDRIICEHVQRGLVSGAYRSGRLSPAREAGVWHWQNLLRDAYAAGGLAESVD